MSYKKKSKDFWNKIKKINKIIGCIDDCINGNDSESNINEKKNKRKNTWKDYLYLILSIILNFILLSLTISLYILSAFIIKKYYLNKQIDFKLVGILLILFGLTLFFLMLPTFEHEIKSDIKKLKIRGFNTDNIDPLFFDIFKDFFFILKKSTVAYNSYLVTFLSFLSLTIFTIILRIKGLDIQINNYFIPIGVTILFGLLFMESNSFFAQRKIDIIYFVIGGLGGVSIFMSIFYLFSYFFDNSGIKIKNNDLIKISTGINFLYVNGKKLAYIDFTSGSLTKPLEFTGKFKGTDSINIDNLNQIIISGNKVSINKNQLGQITYTGNNNVLTGIIHILPQPNNKIILSNNKLAGEIAGLKLNNLSGSYKDLEKIYSDTLNSSYISIYTTSHMIFNSFLTILLFTITIIFLKQAIKTNNQKKEILNKLERIGLYIELINQEDSKNIIGIKEKILKEIEKDIQTFIPQFPIDNDTKYLDQLTEKILNMINKKKST